MSRNLSYILPLLFLPIFLLAYKFIIPAEDAVILYEYAKNLSANGIITYGRADYPIEGGTDFLLIILIALFNKVGLSEYLSLLALSFVSVIFLIFLVKPLQARLLIVLGILGTPYFYSSLYGFSTIFFSAVYCWCLYLAIQKKNWLYFYILILCLIRPDGIAWGTGLVLWRFLEIKDRAALYKEVSKFFIQLILPGIIYFLWRSWYFSELLPLPFLVKSAGQKDFLIFNYLSLRSISYVLIPAFASIVFAEDRKLYIKRLFVLFLFPCLFYSAINLEQNTGNRFLAPMFFGSMLLLSYQKDLKSLCIFVVVAICFSIFLTLITLAYFYDSRNENIYPISKELSASQGKMLITEAGRLAYYSNWISHDSWGLNTPAYAHSLISKEKIDSEKYDLIVAHCPITFLEDAKEESENDRNRSWLNQCKTLVSYIKSNNYKSILIPYLTSPDIIWLTKSKLGLRSGLGNYCGRYDIYAISPNYIGSKELTNLLLRHGGLIYKESRIDMDPKNEYNICN